MPQSNERCRELYNSDPLYRERILSNHRRYQDAHREELRSKNRERYHKNRERDKANVRKWALANPDKRKTYCARYLERHPNVIRDYQKANPEKVRHWQRMNEAKRRGSKGKCSLDQWRSRLSVYGNSCAYCGTNLRCSVVHREHVIPIAKGGSSWPSNLVPSCKKCNHRKHVKIWKPSMPGPTGILP